MTADEIDEAVVATLREMVAIGPEQARRIMARLRHAGLLRQSEKPPVLISGDCL